MATDTLQLTWEQASSIFPRGNYPGEIRDFIYTQCEMRELHVDLKAVGQRVDYMITGERENVDALRKLLTEKGCKLEV